MADIAAGKMAFLFEFITPRAIASDEWIDKGIPEGAGRNHPIVDQTASIDWLGSEQKI